MGDMITFTDESLGFYRTPEDASLWYGRTPRALRNYLKQQKAPRIFGPLIKDACDTFHFPLDEPPDKAIIGMSAYAAIQALRHGNPDIAVAISAGAISGNLDWETGKPPELNLLQRHWTVFSNCISWVRHPLAELRENGYKLIRSVRRVANCMLREKSKNHPDRDYWQYLRIMSSNYSFVGMAIHHDGRIRAGGTGQKWLMSHCEALLEEAKMTPFRYATALVAWNNCQFAAMAHEPGVFIVAMEYLFAFYGKDRILPMLQDDDDTKAMLKMSRVETYLLRT